MSGSNILSFVIGLIIVIYAGYMIYKNIKNSSKGKCSCSSGNCSNCRFSKNK